MIDPLTAKQNYRTLRQAWRYYHRTHKVDLAILHQLQEIRDTIDITKDPVAFCEVANAALDAERALENNKSIRDNISQCMTRMKMIMSDEAINPS